ncbi:hypothetical protein AAAT91_16815 [Bacteroides uniformis]|jgi:ABC-type multidrug transport system fused ATPase/permease subunit|uniref:hypothetical protein n=1 Tax=Bacteroides uniformis TaxID=820 RepID=UPI0032C19B7F
MKEETLLKILEIHRNDMRLMDEQRSQISNIIFVANLALFGSIGVLTENNRSCWQPIFVIILSIIGIIFVLKLYERYKMYKQLYRLTQEALCSDKNDELILGLKNNLDHCPYFPHFFIKAKLFNLWIFLHLATAIMGIILLIIQL